MTGPPGLSKRGARRNDSRPKPRTPMLPGGPRGTLTYKDPDDQPRTIDHATLRQAIRDALADGPLAKWQLRDRTGFPEAVLARELRDLRLAGAVKLNGKQQIDLKWALASWHAPRAQPQGQTPKDVDSVAAIRAKKASSAGSWWIEARTRDAFRQAQRDRRRQAGWVGVERPGPDGSDA